MFAIGQIARSVHISMAFTFQIWKLRLSIFPLTSLIMRLRTGYVSPSKKVLFSDTWLEVIPFLILLMIFILCLVLEQSGSLVLLLPDNRGDGGKDKQMMLNTGDCGCLQHLFCCMVSRVSASEDGKLRICICSVSSEGCGILQMQTHANYFEIKDFGGKFRSCLNPHRYLFFFTTRGHIISAFKHCRLKVLLMIKAYLTGKLVFMKAAQLALRQG